MTIKYDVMSKEKGSKLSALLNALSPAQRVIYKSLYGDRVIGPEACLGDFESGTNEEMKLKLTICGMYGLDIRGIDVAKMKPASKRIYPDLVTDNNFADRLNSKLEFAENKSVLSSKTIEDVCPSETQPFSLLPYQEYLVNFLSPLTPFRGVLVFHGVGTGKTYTSLAIAEGFKETLQKNPTPQQRRVLVIHLSNSINATYRNALYRARAEESEKRNGMRPGSLHVTSDSYYVKDDQNSLHRRERITKKYEEYYEIVSGDAFMKKVLSMMKHAKSSSPKAWEKVLKVALSDEYSNRVIIVDEVHGLKSHNEETTDDEENTEYRTYDALYDVLRLANNIRLVLMSATPMFHRPSEIVSLVNLLLLNDRQPLLEANDIFKNDVDPMENGLDHLCNKLVPYVSFLRGYNPLSFPRQLEVNNAAVKDLYGHNRVYLPRPKYDLSGVELNSEDHIKYTVLIKCTMSTFQFENYLANMQNMTSKMNVAHNATQKLCTIIYPLDNVSGLSGKQGFDTCFQLVGGNRLTKAFTYRYKPHCKEFLKMENLQKYSSKYFQIVGNIMKSPGLAYVYSENIAYGVETIAMALDANGYDRDGGGNYLVDNGCSKKDKICSICNKRFSDVIHSKDGEELHAFQQARYVILQHQESMQTNINIVERTKAPGNRKGEEIKVILGTPVTKESMDFSNIRQIHIASPWHNMSKITQIIGRGVRNCSHRNLPLQDRDVVIFRYCIANPDKKMKGIPKEFQEIETGDENFWRNSEFGDIAIKKVEREIKRTAFDCSVHKELNAFAGDKDYSRECDYQKCAYECRGQNGEGRGRMDDSTAVLLFNRNEIENVKFTIAKLFETRNVYTFADIKQFYKKSRKSVSDRSIAIALQEMLDGVNGPELVRGRNGASGHLIYVSKYYMFQPLYALDDRIPLAMRNQLPTRQYKAARLHGQNQLESISLNIAETLDRLDKIPDLILQFEELDKRLTNMEEHRELLEAIITTDIEHHLLKYYRNFLLFDENNKLKGHFLTNIPRVMTKQGVWTVGSIADRKRMENVISNLYQESDAEFVGYIDSKGSENTFKIINNLEQRDKTRLNLKKALNTLTTGKTCNTFERVVLNTVANFLDVATNRQENRKSVCERIEYAFRKKQLESADGRRYFYNSIEAYQHLLLSKSTSKKK